ncbi:hypothetical protein Zm00014a_029105 [Zea mays]|uniref:Uncharacterized protein n=1 Tax=Zea mays TaxID=4577 RepID=A0A3L6E9L2_MAIZE|nr:hypothetical protein Zm00014a_029105 [Zea mays]
MLLLPPPHPGAARGDRTGQSGSLQTDDGRFRRGGFGSAPAAASFSELSMFHITCTSWYPQVCTSRWRLRTPPHSALLQFVWEKIRVGEKD